MTKTYKFFLVFFSVLLIFFQIPANNMAFADPATADSATADSAISDSATVGSVCAVQQTPAAGTVKLNVKIDEQADLAALTAVSGGRVVRVGPLNYITLEIDNSKERELSLEDLRQRILRQPGVLSAEWSKKYRIDTNIAEMNATGAKITEMNATRAKITEMNTTGAKIAIFDQGQHIDEQWGLKKIRADLVWEEGVTGEGVIVAVVDTGVDLDFPDFKDGKRNNLVPGYNAITRSEKPRAAQDNNGHGTSVAGIIAALDNHLGIVGVAYNAKIMPIKAMDEKGEGEDADLADGIIWAADHGAKIINLSIGSASETEVLDDALAYAAGKGCLLVGASGNNKDLDKLQSSSLSINNLEGTRKGVNYPAANPNVIAVAATDQFDSIADFALTGPELMLTAPGVKILSDIWQPDGTIGLGYISGTSVAAPFVSGTAALLWSKYPSLTPAEIRLALFSSAYDLGPEGLDPTYGYGRLDAYRALKTLDPLKTFSSPAALGWEGGRVLLPGSGEEAEAELTVPAGAFAMQVAADGTDHKMTFRLEAAPSVPDFPQGIEPAGVALTIAPWGEATAGKPLRLKVNLSQSPRQDQQIAHLYQLSGSRWIRVGGGFPASAETMEVPIYDPGIYRAGWSPAPEKSRIFGPDRIHTALEIAREAFPTGADTVILTRSDSYPDALAGVPLSYKYHAPILLTHPQKLPDEVRQLIKDLGPKNILILGGNQAVSLAIEDSLRSIAEVTRLSGETRYETASAIAGMLGTKGQAVVVSGANFPDAIAVASPAALAGIPILLTPANSLDEVTDYTLKTLSVVSTEVIGGPSVVSAAVYGQLPEPARLYGNNRYATSAAVVKTHPPQGGILYAATGTNFPDALTGGVLAAGNSSGILLLSPQGLTPEQTEVLQALSGKKVIVLGGTGAVSDAVLSKVQELVQ